jgi:hypothetical protein
MIRQIRAMKISHKLGASALDLQLSWATDIWEYLCWSGSASAHYYISKPIIARFSPSLLLMSKHLWDSERTTV